MTLPITAKEDIYKMFKEGEKGNKPILEMLKTKYGVSVTAGYISYLRKTQNIQDLTMSSKDVERKMKEKIKIDANILEIAAEFTDAAKEWLMENKGRIKDFDPKSIAMVTSAFHKFFKSYQEMAGGVERQETIHSKIIKMDKMLESKEG